MLAKLRRLSTNSRRKKSGASGGITSIAIAKLLCSWNGSKHNRPCLSHMFTQTSIKKVHNRSWRDHTAHEWYNWRSATTSADATNVIDSAGKSAKASTHEVANVCARGRPPFSNILHEMNGRFLSLRKKKKKKEQTRQSLEKTISTSRCVGQQC